MPVHVDSRAIDKWAIYDKVLKTADESPTGRDQHVWEPHRGQLAIEEDNTRNQVAACGRRFGKSYLGGKRLVVYAFLAYYRQKFLRDMGIRMEYWIVGPEYSDAEKEFRVLYNTLSALGMPFDRPGTYNDPISGNMHISLWGGMFQVHAKSAKYPETLVGEGLHGVVLAEAAKQKPSVWTKYVKPTLSDFDGWSLHTSTPEGKNHFYDHYQSGQDPNDPEWASWRMPAWVNQHVYKTPTLDRDVATMQALMREFPTKSPFKIVEEYDLVVDRQIISTAADMSIESFNQEIAADFTEYVGQVFKDWDEEYHVDDLHFNPDWETYAAVDYGYTNPNVWLLLQVGPWDEINVLREVFEKNLTAEAFADEIRRRQLNPPQLHRFYPDPARPDSSVVLSDRLGIRAAGGTGGELAIRLDLIRAALKRGRSKILDPSGRSWRPQLMVDRSCTQMRREFEAYKYPDTKDKPNPSAQTYEAPLKKDDHTPEALGRFMVGYFGARSLVREGHGTTISTMSVNTTGAPETKSRRSRNAPKAPQYQSFQEGRDPSGYEYKRSDR
jgi:hypothetical protein